MSEFKGTPGPWKISDESEKWNRIVDCHNENLIVTCYAMQSSDDYNAKLIASAPEMLQVLQRLDAQLRKAWDEGRLPWDVIDTETTRATKIIITKALGTDQ